MKNRYKTLRVSSDATLEQMRKARREILRGMNPSDHGGKDDEAIKNINEAFSVIRDPIKRAEHDQELLDASKEVQVVEPVVTPTIVEEKKAPPPEIPKRQPPKVATKKVSPYAEDVMIVFIIAFLVIFSTLYFKNNKQSNIGVAPVTITTTVIKGSREDPSMAEFYRILDARTELGCKYKYPGVTGGPGEDPNVGCRGTPPIYRN